MAKLQSLRSHLISQLRELRDAEQQLTRVLPDFASRATSPALRLAFAEHLKETVKHIDRLEQAYEALRESPPAKRCEGMHGLIREGNTVVNSTPAGALRDAVMITSAQKVEHYEMASYGTARTYATVLGERKVARLLEDTLQEEKNADATLTKIAEGTVNEKAAEEWHQVGEGVLVQTAALAGKAVGVGTRTIRLAADAVGLGKGRRGGSGKSGPPQVASPVSGAADTATTHTAASAGKEARPLTAAAQPTSRRRASGRPHTNATRKVNRAQRSKT